MDAVTRATFEFRPCTYCGHQFTGYRDVKEHPARCVGERLARTKRTFADVLDAEYLSREGVPMWIKRREILVIETPRDRQRRHELATLLTLAGMFDVD